MSDTIRHLRARVEHARYEEDKALKAWLASGGDQGERESLWASWIVARSALDRSVSMLRDELADRERLGVKT